MNKKNQNNNENNNNKGIISECGEAKFKLSLENFEFIPSPNQKSVSSLRKDFGDTLAAILGADILAYEKKKNGEDAPIVKKLPELISLGHVFLCKFLFFFFCSRITK